MKWFTCKLLKFAEACFLFTHGWRYEGRDRWRCPEGYPVKKHDVYRGGHALNSQRWTNANLVAQKTVH